MPKLGLIGFPLSHSFSEKYFSEKFQKEGLKGWDYSLYPIEAIERLPNLIQSDHELIGLNVTIPYKKAVVPYLNALSPEAAEIGAVNTIMIRRENGISLTGYNTDAQAFEKCLTPHLASGMQSALVLGTGGGAAAVAYVLKKLNIAYKFVSRNPLADQLGYQDLQRS
nr:shikimate dehydrogenase [Bacteroidota bacterium]